MKNLPMNANDMTDEEHFRQFVSMLFQSRNKGTEGLLHAAVGLSGESGEVLDHIKKLWVYDRPLDREQVIEEMGDVFHYFTMLMIGMDVSLKEIMEGNVAKLIKRYPNGFSKSDAIARADQNGKTQ